MRLNWVEAEALEKEGGSALLDGADGILVPGGFGSRGTRGMMKAAEYAREHGVPFFGICYGFQWATVEFARNVCGLEGADSTEVDENAPHKVIYKLRDLLGVDELGGTMRLGRYACELAPGLAGASGSTARRSSHERHRHRFEFNCLYETELAEQGHARLGPLARRQVRRDRGAAVAPLVRGGAVPPRVPVEAAAAASAVCQLRRGGATGTSRASWNRSACRARAHRLAARIGA